MANEVLVKHSGGIHFEKAKCMEKQMIMGKLNVQQLLRW